MTTPLPGAAQPASLVTLLFFASLREALGERSTHPWSPGLTVGALRQALRAHSPQHAQALAPQQPVRCAVNQVLVDDAAAIPLGAEVAFFPPVTGG